MTPALLLLAWLAMPQPDVEARIEVLILEPSTLEAVFGEVEVAAEVRPAEEVTRVELFLDGRTAGALGAPPYRWRVDVGQENVEHRFRVVAHGPFGASGSSTIITPRIRVDEEVDLKLQQLYVTASAGDARVLDLEEGDFRVLDNGAEQRLVTFGRGDLPLTAVLLLDSSESMRGARLSAALAGAEAFVDGMRSLDEAMLLLFSDQILDVTPFTHRREELRAALAGVEARGNTSINDHLYLALKLLDPRQGRRVVVLFTDGADLHSVLDMEEVRWKARRSQALIYWIRLADRGGGDSFSTAWRDAAANRRQGELLERTVVESGGRLATLDRVEEIEPAFRDILRELREQYVLGYYPSAAANDGRWHEVAVKVARPGVKIRARGGYVDY